MYKVVFGVTQGHAGRSSVLHGASPVAPESRRQAEERACARFEALSFHNESDIPQRRRKIEEALDMALDLGILDVVELGHYTQLLEMELDALAASMRRAGVRLDSHQFECMQNVMLRREAIQTALQAVPALCIEDPKEAAHYSHLLARAFECVSVSVERAETRFKAYHFEQIADLSERYKKIQLAMGLASSEREQGSEVADSVERAHYAQRLSDMEWFTRQMIDAGQRMELPKLKEEEKGSMMGSEDREALSGSSVQDLARSLAYQAVAEYLEVHRYGDALRCLRGAFSASAAVVDCPKLAEKERSELVEEVVQQTRAVIGFLVEGGYVDVAVALGKCIKMFGVDRKKWLGELSEQHRLSFLKSCEPNAGGTSSGELAFSSAAAPSRPILFSGGGASGNGLGSSARHSSASPSDASEEEWVQVPLDTAAVEWQVTYF